MQERLIQLNLSPLTVVLELNSRNPRIKGCDLTNEPFEQILEVNLSTHASRYQSLAETLLNDSLVVWEYKGVQAKVELLNGRILGSLKPSTYSNFTEPLSSAPISESDEEIKSEATDLIAWLETEIVTKY